LFDIIIISLAIYVTQGIETDFYLIYFLAIFISSVGQSIGGTIPIAVVASVLYVWLIFRSNPGISIWDSKFLLRIPFLFMICLISSYWSETTRKELKKKEELEKFNRELKDQIERATAKEIEMRRYSEKIIDRVASGIIAILRDGLVTTVNPEAERIFGYSKNELLGYSITSLAGLQSLWTKMKFVMDMNKPVVRDETTTISKTGAEIPIGFNITPLDGAKGEINGCVVIFKDLSEVRKLEDKLKHAERLSYLGKMASWVAHEIRNPLTTIDGFTQLLDDVKDNEKKVLYISEIRKGTQRMNHIIDDILTFARARKVEYKKLPLRDLIDEILKSTLPTVKVSIDGKENPSVKAEVESIRRLFINLITNSIEALDANGSINIGFSNCNGFIITHIKDTGRGIPQKELEKIFTPFFTTKPRGTGLGLSIVKKIVDEHNGKIEIESQEGAGTECRVWLPIYDESKNEGNS
jgi:PAS domain S-box-containing protein